MEVPHDDGDRGDDGDDDDDDGGGASNEEWWCLTNRRTPSYGIPLIDNIIALTRSRLLHFFRSFQTLRTQNAS